MFAYTRTQKVAHTLVHIEAMRYKRRWENPWTNAIWHISSEPRLKVGTDDCDGACDYEKKQILLNQKLQGRDLLITLLEEMWHAKGQKNRGHIVRRRLDTILGDIADILISSGLVRL